MKQAGDFGIGLLQRLASEQVKQLIRRLAGSRGSAATPDEQARCAGAETELELARLALRERLRLDEAETERGQSEAAFWKERCNDFDTTNRLLLVRSARCSKLLAFWKPQPSCSAQAEAASLRDELALEQQHFAEVRERSPDACSLRRGPAWGLCAGPRAGWQRLNRCFS